MNCGSEGIEFLLNNLFLSDYDLLLLDNLLFGCGFQGKGLLGLLCLELGVDLSDALLLGR